MGGSNLPGTPLRAFLGLLEDFSQASAILHAAPNGFREFCSARRLLRPFGHLPWSPNLPTLLSNPGPYSLKTVMQINTSVFSLSQTPFYSAIVPQPDPCWVPHLEAGVGLSSRQKTVATVRTQRGTHTTHKCAVLLTVDAQGIQVFLAVALGHLRQTLHKTR